MQEVVLPTDLFHSNASVFRISPHKYQLDSTCRVRLKRRLRYKPTSGQARYLSCVRSELNRFLFLEHADLQLSERVQLVGRWELNMATRGMLSSLDFHLVATQADDT